MSHILIHVIESEEKLQKTIKSGNGHGLIGHGYCFLNGVK